MDTYLKSILQERSWSWSFAAIIFILIALILRRLILGPVIRNAKSLDKEDYKLFKKNYFRSSLFGWIFFLLSMIFAVILWINNPTLPFNQDNLNVLAGLLASFLLCLIFHLIAFANAAIKTLQHYKEKLNPTHAYPKNYPLS